MIIVLKEADFSQSNIGRITLPEEVYQFLPITEEVLSQFSTQFSSKQKTAVDMFFRELSKGEVLSKIKILMLPLLASNLDEACVNVLTKSNVVTNNAGLTLSSKGIMPIFGKPTANIQTGFDYFHIAAYANSTGNYLTDSSGNKKTQFLLSTNRYLIVGKNLANGSSQPSVQYSTFKIAMDVNYSNNNSSIIASYDSSTNELYGSVGGNVYPKNKYNGTPNSNDWSRNICIGQYTDTGSYDGLEVMFPALQNAKISIITVGDFINEEQHRILDSAMENLNNAFLA